MREAYIESVTANGDVDGGWSRELCEEISPKQLRWFLFSSTENRVCLPQHNDDRKKTRE